MTASTRSPSRAVPALAAAVGLLAASLAAQPTAPQLTLVNALPDPAVTFDVNGAFATSGFPPVPLAFADPLVVSFGLAAPFVVDFREVVAPGTPAPAPLATATLDVAADQQGVVVVHPDGSGQATATAFLDDPTLIPVGGPARVAVRNVSDFSGITVILVGATSGSSFVSTPAIGTQDVSSLPAEDYTIEILGPSGAVLLSDVLTLRPNILDNLHVVGDATVGVQLIRTEQDRGIATSFTLTTLGSDCAGVVSQGVLQTGQGGSALSFTVNGIPGGSGPFGSAPTFLLVGLTNPQLPLGGLGAPGCTLGVDPAVILPVDAILGFAATGFSIPPSVSVLLPTSYWQFVFTGASNPVGLGFTRTFELAPI